MTESQYQSKIVKKLGDMFPGSVVLKIDGTQKQGFPDLLVLWGEFRASLEVKLSAQSHVQPNQDYYVETLNEMGFAAYIYPDNEEEVLNALQQAFESPRRARVLKS